MNKKPFDDYSREAKVLEVKDGDTIVVMIDLGFKSFKQEEIRMLEVWAPETYRPKTPQEKEEGLMVKNFLSHRLPVGASISVRSHKPDGKDRDKYGRYVAEVWDSAGNVNQAVRAFMSLHGIKENRK